MIVLFDASCLMKELTGIGVYVRDLLEHMIPMDTGIQYIIFMNALKDPTPRFPWDTAPNVRVVRRRIPGKLLLELWRRNAPPSVESLAGSRPDVFHSPNFLYQRTGCSTVLTTIHDLAFLKRNAYGGRYSGRYHRETLVKNIRDASHCIVVSRSVAEDLQDLCGIASDQITVIHHGLNPVFRPGPETPLPIPGESAVPDRFFLTVGSVEPRKNMPLLVHAFARSFRDDPGMSLVIAGRRAEGIRALETAVRESGMSDRILITGYVTLDHLVALYQRAVAAVFPSWEEGFGFPALEALACGTPVLASDIPVHREILGDAPCFFECDSIEALSRQLSEITASPERRIAKRDAGLRRAAEFSWAAAAQKHITLYRRLAE